MAAPLAMLGHWRELKLQERLAGPEGGAVGVDETGQVVEALALDEQRGDRAATDIDGAIGVVGDFGFEDAESAQPLALEGDLFSGVKRLFLF